MKNILVVVDYQNDFVDGALGFEKALTLEDGIVSEVENTLSSGGKVFFTLDTHTDNYLETREGKHLPVMHCADGSDGHALYGKLSKYVGKNDVSIVKKSGFGSPALAGAVREVCGGEPECVRICGVVTNMCVIANAIVLQSEFDNCDIQILEKCCASFDEDLHNKAIDVMKNMHMTIVE